MQKSVEDVERTVMSPVGQILCAVLLAASGALFSLGAMPASIGMAFAVPLLVLLLLRAMPALACVAAGAYAALSFVTASFPAFLLALGVLLGGALLARGVRQGEDRASLCISLSFSFLLFGAAAVGYTVYASMTAEGKSEFLPYLSDRMDSLVSSATAEYNALFERVGEMYANMGQEVIMPSEAEIHTTMTRLFSLAPGWIILIVFVFSLLLTYLTQLLSMLTDRTGGEPLYTENSRAFRLGVPLAVLYLAVVLVDFFWRDYTSIFSLTVMNAQTVLVPLFAFGGLSFLPKILYGMRRAENGRVAYLVWFILFLLLCLLYVQYAMLFFGIVYAISIFKNALRSRRENG
ncbi:MAG: DUF2232 domain-containing protein [Clostridia bacterium]|nr:DUF2232 domain-containing protein [Clostridia bacterium]